MLRNQFFAILFLSIAAIVSAQPTDIGPIVVRPDLKTYAVVARSSDNGALALLQRAMNFHGGYRLVGSMKEASFAFDIAPVGSTAAQVVITSGVPEQELYRETVVGESRDDAILKAIDKAIFKSSGSPGFFAGKIAYVGEHQGKPELFVRNFFFGEGKRLTGDGADIVRPRWSPDGRYIVYTSYRSGYPNIYRMDMVQQRWIELAKFEGINTSARYSPDGSRLAMVLSGGGNANIYVGNSDPSAMQLRNISNSRGQDASPGWSPDGRQILFASDMNGGLRLFRVPASGGAASHVPTAISGYCAEPDWNAANPDLVAFTAAVGDKFQIAVYSFQQNRSRFATSEAGDAVEAQWLNDGRHMIYTWRTVNKKRIVLFDTMTGSREQLSLDSLGDASQASFLMTR